MRRWAGPLIAVLILGGIVLILALNLNLNLNEPRASSHAVPQNPPAQPPANSGAQPKPAGFREYPIGEPVEKNGIQVSAVWLPPIEMEGMGNAGADIIHLEADVKATEGNPNGFAMGEFVPYLKIAHEIVLPPAGAAIQKGELMLMIARTNTTARASRCRRPDRSDLTMRFSPHPPAD